MGTTGRIFIKTNFKKTLLVFCALFFALILPFQASAQNTIGIPEVINYEKLTYKAGLQNWDIKQDKNGIIYVANNEGMLSFDGNNWKLYPLPNRTIVRSLEMGSDDKIYVGGQDELGYFSPNSQGILTYHSLTELLAPGDRLFRDVWDIIETEHGIFFRTNNRIIRYLNQSMTSFLPSSEWLYMGLCDGKLYAHDNIMGLFYFDLENWVPASKTNILPQNDPITGMNGFKNSNPIITTLKNGFYTLDANGITKKGAINNPNLNNLRIYSSIKLGEELIAIGTIGDGVIILNQQGEPIQSFSKKEGMQNNNVLCLFLDVQKNLWIGLDNGVDFVAYNSPIKQINPVLQDAPCYAISVFNNELYIGTSNGLYYAPLENKEDLSFSKADFKSVQNCAGQTWNLSVINDQLLLGHNDGAFSIKNHQAFPIATNTGFWNFIPASTSIPFSKIIAGNYKGIREFDIKNQNFVEQGNSLDFNESSRFVAIDAQNRIWISHPYQGVYKMSLDKNNQSVKAYSQKNGLPSNLNNFAFKIKNEVLIATEQGIYQYNEPSDSFLPSAYYAKILGNKSIRYLKEDMNGNIWFVHDKNVGVIDFSNPEPELIELPELKNKIVSGHEFIYPFNQYNVFVGSEKGAFQINYDKYKRAASKVNVRIQQLSINLQTDSVIFGGYFETINGAQKQTESYIPSIPHAFKTLKFEFGSSIFGNQSTMEYSYRLKGFNENWSEWSPLQSKEFTNLGAGKYIFEVKARSNPMNESAVASYTFIITPPWYQSKWAIFLYLLMVAGITYGLIKRNRTKFDKQKNVYEEEQRQIKYIHDLEIQKNESELMALKNEKLASEIDFKNSELASSAMHLVKKGEIIKRIKDELNKVIPIAENPKLSSELKKIIKTLHADEEDDNDWEKFSKHFDKVHSDFLVLLKEKHPTITPHELKLSAYLRMNLSSKEIAQLLNISLRGVEIGRYRLRKKLNLVAEQSLFDYLINIKPPLA